VDFVKVDDTMFKKFRRLGKTTTKYQLTCTVLRLDHIPSTASQVKVVLSKNNKEVETSFVPVTHCKGLPRTARFDVQITDVNIPSLEVDFWRKYSSYFI
jgi:hypothetical protein